MLQRTPLWAAHQRLGARLIDFGGWEMPIQYSGILDEHQAVRTGAGAFDISHMGELFVTGPAAEDFLNSALTNDLRKCSLGHGQYTLMCNEDGGVVDDLYVYRVEPLGYMLVVNASRTTADFAWLEQQLAAFPMHTLVTLVNASAQRGAIAVQGPRVKEFIDCCFVRPAIAGLSVQRPTELKKNELAAFPFADTSVWVARTGYTGEDGFELIAPASITEAVWNSLFDAGKAVALKPCGLGARDTLRTEMCYPLYGHELDEGTTPLEAGLGAFVAFDKGNFKGGEALSAQKAAGLKRRCVAFRMQGKAPPPRPGYPVFSAKGGESIGKVVSGTQSPSLGIGIGLGYISTEFAKAGTELGIEIRGRISPAEVVSKPIYRKPV